MWACVDVCLDVGVNYMYVCIAFLPEGTFSSPPMILFAHSGQLSHCYAELEAKHVSMTWMKGRWGGKRLTVRSVFE